MQRAVAVFLLCFVRAAFGCVPFGPGGDDGELQPFELTNSPRFALVYSPPVGWTTAPANPTTEQARDVDEAKLQILINVVEAFRVGFASLNAVLPTSIEYNVDAMRPEERTVAADGAVPNAEEGLVAAGVMDRVCRPTSPATTCEGGAGILPLVLNHTIFLVDGPLLSGAQWRDVANKLFTELSNGADVLFRSPIVLTKS
ncbi:hypothetical protein M3Y99_01946600 [Aphelenchoides fujianensis]|nr:hypothetical protein M3Y99_01946600 [Aphelenchoides fujianensis]